MQIVRTLWGTDISQSTDLTNNKSFESNQFDDEQVLVWGDDNKEILDNLGYPNTLMSSDAEISSYSSQEKKYFHKLEAIKKCDELYSEYILIDWDVYSNKTIDSTFITKLRNKATVQVPLYAYPSNYKTILDSHFAATASILTHFNEFDSRLSNYSWDLSGSYILPQFAFYYSRGANLGSSLLSSSLAYDLKSNVEEFALYHHLNCSLDSYIEDHEPEVALGRPANSNQDFNQAKIALEGYITGSKDIYFTHY